MVSWLSKAPLAFCKMMRTIILPNEDRKKNGQENKTKISYFSSQCLKITEKGSFNIASEASDVCMLNEQKLINNCRKWSILASFWKPEACGQTVLPDRSLLIGQKFVGNAKIQKFKYNILSDFQTMRISVANCMTIVKWSFCLTTSNVYHDFYCLIYDTKWGRINTVHWLLSEEGNPFLALINNRSPRRVVVVVVVGTLVLVVFPFSS